MSRDMVRSTCEPDLARLERLYDPARFSEIVQLHRHAFAWQPQGRIPLGIHVVNPDNGRKIDYAQWLDPVPFFDLQVRVLADTLAVGSDVLPAVPINHLGEAVVTSMFGAEQFMPESTSATLQDVGPTPLQVYQRIDEVADVEVPSTEAGIMSEVIKMVEYYRQRLPAWVHLVAPMPSGPFSAAAELRGSEIMLDVIDSPDLCHRLIDLCAQAQVQVERTLRGISGEPFDRHVTNFGIDGAGLRLGEDMIVNLSAEMIEEFCVPVYKRVCEELPGRGHIHFCTLPHSRFDHVFPVLSRAPDVAVVSTQFGYEYYTSHLNELRGRLAVESFYGDAYAHVCSKYGSFRNWADEFVPRFKHESGLVMYCQVSSVEEGKKLWSVWQKAHEE